MKVFPIYFFVFIVLSLGIISCTEDGDDPQAITCSAFEYHSIEFVEDRYYWSENTDIVPTGAFAFLHSIDTIIAEILPGIEEEASLVMRYDFGEDSVQLTSSFGETLSGTYDFSSSGSCGWYSIVFDSDPFPELEQCGDDLYTYMVSLYRLEKNEDDIYVVKTPFHIEVLRGFEVEDLESQIQAYLAQEPESEVYFAQVFRSVHRCTE